jgi:uncharacterized protein
MIKLLVILAIITGQVAAGQNTILWEVTDTVTHKKSFIAGTFHHIGNSFADSIPELKRALLQAEIAVFESVEDGKGLVAAINNRKQPNAIEKLVSNHDFIQLKKMSAAWKVDLANLEPVELVLILRQEFQKNKCKTVKPTDQWDHFDNYLIHLARTNHIAVLGLETDSSQLGMVTEIYNSAGSVYEQEEINYWISRFTNKEDSSDEECLLVQKYMNLDLDYEFLTSCEDDILVQKRNNDWMRVLPDLLSAKNCFVAVGLLHLKYKCGLLESLKQKGFMIKPVFIKPNRS